jgi:glyoxylase-like metal-dependent hydrolase (beta-lactamase superfamily II)
MQKIKDNVFAETEFGGCNPGFVVTSQGIVMIDSPMMPTDAVKWRDEIAKYGPVIYLINTEPHEDHFTGNYFFEGKVVGHEGTRKAVSGASVQLFKEHLKHMDPGGLSLVHGFEYRPPTITFSERLTLYVGDHTFQCIHLPGHTPFQIAVYVPEERVVFTSDNVTFKLQVWLHDSLPYQLLDSLKRIQELEADVLIPGHGSICDRSYIPELSGFIQDWIDAVTKAIDQGLSREEAQEKISFLDRYPMKAGVEFRAKEVQRNNVARLYEVLKK